MDIIEELKNIIWGRYKQFDDLILSGGRGIYSVIKRDLSVARTDEKIPFWGDSIIIQKIDSQAYLKLNNIKNDSIDINLVRSINTRYNNLYLTNEANEGILHILVGSKGIFNAIQNYFPINPNGKKLIFEIARDELAVRTGSPVSFDRRGDVYHLDDFEATDCLKWATFTTEAGGSVALSKVSARNGNQSLKLTTGSDAVAKGTAYIYKYLPLPIQSRIGVESSFTIQANTDYLIMEISCLDGTTQYSGTVYYDYTNTRLIIKNSAGGNTVIASNIEFLVNDLLFMTWKLVIDYSTGKYVKLIFGNVSYDLSDYNLYSTASALSPYMIINITHGGTVGNNPFIYIDDVIITENEP